MSLFIDSVIKNDTENENEDRMESKNGYKYGNESGNVNDRRTGLKEGSDREEGREGRKRDRQDLDHSQKEGKIIRRGTIFSLFISILSLLSASALFSQILLLPYFSFYFILRMHIYLILHILEFLLSLCKHFVYERMHMYCIQFSDKDYIESYLINFKLN